MDFTSLVLMQRNNVTKYFEKELGSFEVGGGAAYITKLFCQDNVVNVNFDTKNDVEEWEYTAIFYLFNIEPFENNGFKIEEIDSEYNPTWCATFEYVDDHLTIEKKLNDLCQIIENEITKVMESIKGKKELYS